MIAYNSPGARGDIETFIAYARPCSPKEPYRGAVELSVMVFLPVPLSWSQKKRMAAINGELHHVKKPDCDNYLKFACDCMNGMFWDDDCQVIRAIVEKKYSNAPRWEIEVKQLSGELK
jgi:Holliday junction resolvase RusA-like endonuclease